jgi:hypothetical protein
MLENDLATFGVDPASHLVKEQPPDTARAR